MKKSEIKIYETPDGKTSIEVKLEKETVWLNLNQISELFERDKSVISRHINNIYKEAELDKHSTVAKIATVQKEGGREIARNITKNEFEEALKLGKKLGIIIKD